MESSTASPVTRMTVPVAIQAPLLPPPVAGFPPVTTFGPRPGHAPVPAGHRHDHRQSLTAWLLSPVTSSPGSIDSLRLPDPRSPVSSRSPLTPLTPLSEKTTGAVAKGTPSPTAPMQPPRWYSPEKIRKSSHLSISVSDAKSSTIFEEPCSKQDLFSPQNVAVEPSPNNAGLHGLVSRASLRHPRAQLPRSPTLPLQVAPSPVRRARSNSVYANPTFVVKRQLQLLQQQDRRIYASDDMSIADWSSLVSRYRAF